jgi:sodium pump decarboxylase gamma subunit
MELLRQAVVIMALGMAVVFAFLAIVILGVNVTARIVRRREGAPREEPPRTAPDDRRLQRVAAIAAALHAGGGAPSERSEASGTR